MPKSLYAEAGGKPGDIIFHFENESVSADLSAAGTWYSEKRDLPLSLTDLCNDTPINGKHHITCIEKISKGVTELSFSLTEHQI